MTKYYSDQDGNYLGAFDGETGKEPVGAMLIPMAPLHADAKWDGAQWIEPDLTEEEQVQVKVVKSGVTIEDTVAALVKAVGMNDRTDLDTIVKVIQTAQAQVAQ